MYSDYCIHEKVIKISFVQKILLVYDKDLWLSAASLKNYYETEIKIKKFVPNSAFLLNISKLFIVINRVTKKSENYEFNAFSPFVFYLSC